MDGFISNTKLQEHGFDIPSTSIDFIVFDGNMYFVQAKVGSHV